VSKNQEQEQETTTGKTVLRKVGECLYRNESSGTYYALVKKGGKQFRHSLKTKERKVAERSLAQYRQDVARLTMTADAKDYTFKDVAERWLERLRPTLKTSSALRRATSLVKIYEYMGKLPIRSVSARSCEEWSMERGAGIAASTYNNERDTIIAVLEFARREGLILNNPAKDLKRRKQPKTQILIPSREQFSTLVRTLQGLDIRYHEAANLIELLGYSGMRLAEATSLKWEDVNFEKKRFIVKGGDEGTKNHEVREVPLFPALEAFLTALKAKRQAKPGDSVILIDSAKNALERACKKNTFPHFTHHCMRHYFASNAIEAGIDFKVIAAWFGHKDGGLLVARTYGHLRDSHSQEMAKRMTFSANQ